MKKTLEIRHAVSGRIRFRACPIYHNPAAALELAEYAKTIPGVMRVRTNSKCAALIVRYDQAVLSEKKLAVDIGAYKAFIRKKTPAADSPRCRRQVGRTGLKAKMVRFIGLSVLTAVVFVREVIFRKPLAQHLLSPLGIVVTVMALPLVKDGLAHIRERRFTLESFLGASIIAACAAGETAAALEILWITSGGKLLQAWITERSRRSIRDILQVTAKNTYVLVDGVEIEVAVDDVRPDDIVVLHTGEKISVDGEIVNGEAILDESPISGRAEPVARYTGDPVFAGTFVRQGVIFVRARDVGDKTYLSRVLRMVEDSLENKAPIQGVADQLAANLIKVGFGVTLATWLLTASLWRAFTVMLVMACPCATILSASSAISAALSAAARRHILIKGGRYLEEAGRAEMVCFDKTGTLTTNEPVLCRMVNISDQPDEYLLQLACSAEMHNFHPVALALKKEAAEREIQPIAHDVCEYILGKGVRAEIHGSEVLVGGIKLMGQYEIDLRAVDGVVSEFQRQGLTIIFIVEEQLLLGVMGFANPDRPDVDQVIDFLAHDGVRETVLITGDEQCSAAHLASRLNIGRCYDSIMPEEKAGIVRELKADGHTVLMVGDGINDALALAEADIGIAMGAGGSEVAIEAADIALVKDDLHGLIYVRSLSHATISVVHQNFWIATGTNVLGVILGAMGILSPVAAGLIHIVHTLGILANSGRLLIYEPPPLDLKRIPRKALPAPETRVPGTRQGCRMPGTAGSGLELI